MTTDVINNVPRDDFQREERYVVVKISKMHTHPEFRRQHLAALKAENSAALVDCLVIEKDWPEYEAAWSMIEARMTGATAQPAADGEREAFDLAYQCAVDNGWDSTKELSRYMWDQARAAQPAKAEGVAGLRDALKSAREYIGSQPVKTRPFRDGNRSGHILDDGALTTLRILDKIDAALAAAPVPPVRGEGGEV